MKTDIIIAATLAAAMATLSSCDHKELCFNHPEHALRFETDAKIAYNYQWEIPYRNLTHWQTDWDNDLMGCTYESLLPVMPSGIRVAMYQDEGPRIVDNINPEGGMLHMRPGKNSVIFYNNDTEYIDFDDMDSFATAKATTRGRSRASYTGSPYRSEGSRAEFTVAPPDELFGHYIDNYDQKAQTTPMALQLTMQPLVFTYLVRYEFSNGIKYVRLGRGALAGMARSVSLSSGQTSKDDATLLYDATIKPWGVEAVVKSFGVPDFPNDDYSRGDRVYGLNLEVRLGNGKIFTFDFDVTDQVVKQPHGGVIVVRGIEIPDKEGSEGGGSFDVTVDDWGEWEDIDMDL